MNDQQISGIIGLLRCNNTITTRQKDILDTWDVLQENPLDINKAYKQLQNNKQSYPDVYMEMSALPGMVSKTVDQITQEDITFSLRYQLNALIEKEMGIRY